ncbi:choice-of-anchor tandem repeat GloVer-containing protein [uncultured Flavobacterium sp.]|uniref:choice-of-anchor tandem repeat GloVer-containing protein n=1 Tax=uncultured Flavobacterium sp. TaxID=165435 RepID=UPI0025D4EA36|nr:choice-of-anchor tandem repeat GloVer-containing protein [uncultured Flavobacterium sp.]
MPNFTRNIQAAVLAMLFVFSTAHSQKELLIYKSGNPVAISGAPLEGFGHDQAILHTFDPTGIEGSVPLGRLLQASNGKLYGIAASPGGQDIPDGVLFEVDPATGVYKVLNNTIVNSYAGNLFGLIEPVPGLLYGTTNGGRSVFKYNIETEEAIIVATLPPFTYNFGNMYPRFNGELTLASDGNLYGVTHMAPSVQNVPYPGGIYRLNMATGQLTKLYVFGTGPIDIMHPIYGTKLVEGAPGKLYGTSYGGAHFGPQGVAPLGSGTLFEYTVSTGIMVKKYDFDFATIGCNPTQIIKDGNKLYGALAGFSNGMPYPNRNGLLYEFDLTTGTLDILHIFNSVGLDIPQGFLLKSSDGNLYGGAAGGIYQYNPVSDTAAIHVNAVFSHELQSPIEVCRKPTWQPPGTAAFTVCEGGAFSLNLHNTNAATYVWRKGSAIIASQITGILDIESAALTHTGIYTCTMTNECGSTITTPVQLSVEACMSLEEAGTPAAIRLYPNPATDVVSLQLPENAGFEIHRTVILNMLGQTVYTVSGSENRIDVSALAHGMFQLVVHTDKGTWTDKFMKK